MIRLASPADLPLLNPIEARAAARFRDHGLAFAADLPLQSSGALQAAQAEGRLLVATDDADVAVGFAVLALLDAGDGHLVELDVDPDHNGKGLGRALIAAAADWARSHGRARLTLTTFREVPFNAPFYGRVGFVEIPTAELTAALRTLREAERAHGVEQAPRLAMALTL